MTVVVDWFEAAYAEVTAQAYNADLEFLLDFHGRNLLEAFHQKLVHDRVRLSYKYLLDELISAAIEEYKENRTVYGTDDFRDLANGLPPLAQAARADLIAPVVIGLK